MYKTNWSSLSVLQFDIFRKEKQLKHCVTTKEGWKTGTMPRFSVSEEHPWKEYRKELAKALHICIDQIYFPKQTHSDIIVSVNSETKREQIGESDALVSNVPGICLAVQTADCVPILLFDPVKNVVAAVHSGWKGTVSKLLTKTIDRMKQEYGCEAENIRAGIGPSIHKHSYEVGDDVIRRVMEVFPNYEALLSPSVRDGKAFFDLWEANRSQLLESGVLPENMEVMGMCSFGLDQLFYSARRDGFETGRMVSCIMLN